MISVDSFRVIVTGVREGNGLDRRLAEPQHSRLSSDPDVALDIFKQVQCCVAGQIFRRGHLGKPAFPVFVDSMPNGADPEGTVGSFLKKPDSTTCFPHLPEKIRARNHGVKTADGADPNGPVSGLCYGLNAILTA